MDALAAKVAAGEMDVNEAAKQIHAAADKMKKATEELDAEESAEEEEAAE